jgi:calcineurin-like phosphoesterase family protein
VIFFTADTHFGHGNIIDHCGRPFENAYEMDKEMVRRWNAVVKETDTVYHLGDVALGMIGIAKGNIERLNGKIILIKGNHDKRNLKQQFFRELFAEIHEELYLPEYDLYLRHVPKESWISKIHLHGHSHGKAPIIKNRMDVGVDTNNFYPYRLDEILSRFQND